MERLEVRKRLARFLRGLAADDLEERIAPVKCSKHPGHDDCVDYYGVPAYGVPDEPSPAPEGDEP